MRPSPLACSLLLLATVSPAADLEWMAPAGFEGDWYDRGNNGGPARADQ